MKMKFNAAEVCRIIQAYAKATYGLTDDEIKTTYWQAKASEISRELDVLEVIVDAEAKDSPYR
jgi:hypothetical protein